MAQDPSDRNANRDELLEKLDQLVNRRRPASDAEQQSVPVLTDALPVTDREDIPTLTDAVSGPGHARDQALGRPEFELVVAMRLAESLEREIVRLGSEFPAHRAALDELRKAIARSLPELIRRGFPGAPGTPVGPADSGEPQPARRK